MARVGPTSHRLAVLPAEGPDARVYETAVRRAIEMMHADGGAIATLDPERNLMVLRVRQVHPRLRPEPMRNSAALRAVDPHIEEASTTVLPATHLWRYYHSGERLIGYTWMTGKPVIMSGDEVQGLPGASAPEDPLAAYHLAVPIFAALPDDAAAPSDDPYIMGVLVVYVNDPRWRFTQNQLHLLEAQATNIALALHLEQRERQEQTHRRLLALLQELTGNVPFRPELQEFSDLFFRRVYVAICGVMDVEAFAAIIPQPDNTLAYHAIVDGGQVYPPLRLREDQAPWWSWVRYGRAVSWLTDEDRRNIPYLRLREWGSQEYLDSQIYVPVKTGIGVTGALAVASHRANTYTREHVALLEMVGRFTGLAIENAQLRAARANPAPSNGGSETERAHALLINSLLGLNSTLDVTAILHDLVEQASELSRGQICGYLEHDRQTNELAIRDIAQNKEHIYPEALGLRIPVGNGRLKQAMEGQVQQLEDLDSEYGRGDLAGSLLQRYHAQSMLMVPVIHQESVTHRDRIFGLLGIYAPDQQAVFSPNEVMNLVALGRVAAAAINNARTYAQLRELDHLKDEFVLTASHEFRTPMSAIQGFSWLIQRRGESMTPEQGRHWTNEIIRATEQLKDMMDTITESWRTRSVQLPPPQPVQVIAALTSALEILAAQLAADHHETSSQVPETLWVMGEQDRLRHVLSNLVSNAAKYSPASARIVITAAIRPGADLLSLPRERGARDDDEEQVQHVTPGSGPWAVISVHDEGQGISLADQHRLFAKFVRLKLTTSVRGTGLGLYICRRYIEGMGGEIWVESAPGRGSTFSFCLPLAQPLTDTGKLSAVKAG